MPLSPAPCVSEPLVCVSTVTATTPGQVEQPLGMREPLTLMVMGVSQLAHQSVLHLGVLGIRGGTLRSASGQVWVVQ